MSKLGGGNRPKQPFCEDWIKSGSCPGNCTKIHQPLCEVCCSVIDIDNNPDICSNYANGMCNNERCKKPHPTLCNPECRRCTFHAKGQCRWGSKCRNVHAAYCKHSNCRGEIREGESSALIELRVGVCRKFCGFSGCNDECPLEHPDYCLECCQEPFSDEEDEEDEYCDECGENYSECDCDDDSNSLYEPVNDGLSLTDVDGADNFFATPEDILDDMYRRMFSIGNLDSPSDVVNKCCVIGGKLISHEKFEGVKILLELQSNDENSITKKLLDAWNNKASAYQQLSSSAPIFTPRSLATSSSFASAPAPASEDHFPW